MYDLVAGTPAGDACRWGLLFNEDPVRSAPTARILWQAGYDPSVLQVTAEKVSPSSSERFDLDELPVVPTILRTPQGREHVDISDGYRHLRLDVQKGTLLHGPVKLHYQLAGLAGVEPQLLTLQRLLALCRLRRFADGLHPQERRADRWIMMLRACDAAHAGASQRQIASELFGTARVQEDWRGDSDSLRLRVQRMVRNGNTLTGGGYRALLRSA